MKDTTPDTLAGKLQALGVEVDALGRVIGRVGPPGRSVAQAAHAKLRRAFADLAALVDAMPVVDLTEKEETERSLREQLAAACGDLAGLRRTARAWRILALGGWVVVALFVGAEFVR